MKIKEKKTLVIVSVVVFLLIALTVLIIRYTGGFNPVRLTEAEAMKQSVTREYRVNSGEVFYTFRPDGILVIDGNGSTQDFKNLEESQTYFLGEIYKEHTGSYPKDTEQTAVFHCVLDRVKKIVVEEGVTELGDSSCAPFYYAERIVLPESLKKLGTFVFLGTGQYIEEELVYEGIDGKEVEQEPFSFVTMSKSFTDYAASGFAVEEKPALRSVEEQGTVPEREYLLGTVAMGDTISYNLYNNGVLVVSGYGATYDFKHYFEMEEYLLEVLHYVSRQELKEQWFDRVAEIVVEDDVERIGDNALALYRNVQRVTGTPKELGKRAFFSCGADANEGTVWNMDLSQTKGAEDAFRGCSTMPEYETVSDEEKVGNEGKEELGQEKTSVSETDTTPEGWE